jgi:hypothetical protein
MKVHLSQAGPSTLADGGFGRISGRAFVGRTERLDPALVATYVFRAHAHNNREVAS